jgi:putative phosphoesterase
MRLAVMADIHGNLPALEAVLNDLKQYEPDSIIVAGDLVGGLHTVETIRLLRSLGSSMIRGNSDSGLLRYDAGEMPAYRYTYRQFALPRWRHRHIDRETLGFIKSLPEQRVVEMTGTTAVRVVHGSPRNPSEAILPDHDPSTLDLALAQTNEPTLVCGHTHIPWKVERDGRLALNPGAVSGPRNGEVGAQYALLTWGKRHWQVRHLTVPYDLERIRAAYRERGLLEEGGAWAQAEVLSVETGQDVFEDFVSYAFRLAAEAGFQNCDVVPDDIWEHATASFSWDSYSGK